MRQSGFTLLAFCLFDSAVGEYGAPLYARTTDEAVRAFSLMLEDENSTIAKRPGDFRMFLAGEFHQDTGGLVGIHGGPVLVEQSLELVKDKVSSKHVLNPYAEGEKQAYLNRVDGELARLKGGK